MSCHDTLLRDRRIVVMGLGRFGGGLDVAIYAAQQGGRVLVTDLAAPDALADSMKALDGLSIEFRLGAHREVDFAHADVVVVNPAIPKDNRFLEVARARHALITTQINLFLERCPATVVGITGSNGKSTTAALTAHLLRSTVGPSSRYNAAWLGGNIGNRPLLGCLPRIRSEDVVVLELSSFQTEMLVRDGNVPKIGLLTNLTPNHLDRHGTFADYRSAKERLFRLQACRATDPSVSLFCAEDPVGIEWIERYGSQLGRIVSTFGADDVPERLRPSFALPGRANLNNLAGALAIVEALGIDIAQVEGAVPTFQPLPHRLEFVGVYGQVRWFNDSIATTPESTIVALDAIEDPKILIAGGYDKGTGFENLARHIVAKVKAVVLIGQTKTSIAEAIRREGGRGPSVERADSLLAAVRQAARHAQQGDVVLLSPACASYDMFANFQERGDEFKRLVRSLPGKS